MDLRQVSITNIKGIGDKTAKCFKRLQIESVYDLLWHIPRSFVRYPAPKRICDLKEGEFAAIEGNVNYDFRETNYKMLVTTFTVKDGTGTVEMVFFRQNYLRSILRGGKKFVFFGEVKRKGAIYHMEMPEYFTPADYASKQKSLQGIYPLTKGVSSKTIAKHVQRAMDDYFPVSDPFTEEFRKDHSLLSLSDAFRHIHFPNDEEEFREARKTLVFHEFYDFLSQIEKSKEKNTSQPTKYIIKDYTLSDRYEKSIPFTLTCAQQKTLAEIKEDLSSGIAMRRLVQGDVGSGKTMVAFLSMAACAEAGFQSALMAPTEVLATQHFQALIADNDKYNLGLKPVLLTGSVTAAKKRALYEAIKNGEYNVIIGTHAIFQEKVEFRNLALVITDEQHRFGVKQRELLSSKGENPHVLVMSATPIPRTLTLTLYADLKISVINEMPLDRLPIKSCVIDGRMRNTAYQFFRDEIAKGHQGYIICPMVEENEDLSLESVCSYHTKLDEYFKGNIRYGILHGRMKPAEKNRIMESFANKELDLLVSTTVIEVGINVPNATVIMIENAERFGLAALHQLRGRVGRGEAQSYCIFMNGSGKPGENERLEVLHKSNDGFFIAEEDLRLRGPGDINGIRQSGDMEFVLADIIADYDILVSVKESL